MKTISRLLSNPLIVPLALLFLFVLFSLREVPDTWWSIRAGQEILDGKDPYTESWSWTANGDFNPNHQWLYTVYSSILWSLSGDSLALLMISQSLALLLTIIISIPRNTIQRNGRLNNLVISLALVIFFIPLYFNIEIVNELRAQAYSTLLIAILIYFIRNEKFVFIPFLFLFWANFHGGWVSGGILLLSSCFLSLFLYAKKRDPESKRRFITITIVGIASLGLTLVTPLGFRLWDYLYNTSINQPGSVIEFYHPWEVDFYLLALVAILIVVYPLLMMTILKVEKDWSINYTIVSTLVFIGLSFWVNRFIPILLFVSLPALFIGLSNIKPLNDLYFRIKKKNYGKSIKILNVLIAIGVAATIITQLPSYAKDDERKFEIPTSMISSIKDCSIAGPVYNDYFSGAYLLWWMPDHKVYQDNRFDPYPKEVLEYQNLTEGWEERLIELQVSCAFTFKPMHNALVLDRANWPLIDSHENWYLYQNPHNDKMKF